VPQYDVAVIGAGPGGYVAAIRAGQLGLKVVCIEKDERLGGTCLLRGCIPTKAMLHSAEVLETAREAKEHGIEVKGEISVDMAGVLKRKEKMVSSNAKGVEFLFRKNKVDRVHGHARLAGPGRINVAGASGNQVVEAKHVVLASGSAPRLLPGLKVDGNRIVTSDELLENKIVPKRLIVLGAGAVGVEFASVFRRFGSEVTVVEMLPRLVPL